MVKAEDLANLVGTRVMLRLTATAPGGPVVTGRLTGVLPALDGLVVTVAPDGATGPPRTYHYHYIDSVESV